MLVDARIQSIHLCNIANNAGQIREVPRDLVVRVIACGEGSWDAEIDRVQIDREIRPGWES